MAARVDVGDTFAGYLIEGELARGGMGVVFRARDVELDRVVALKLIRPDLSEDDAYRQRFRAESRTAARIEHPNVVSIYEAREREGTLYLVMQFVHGHDLRAEIVERGRLEPERAVTLVEGAAAGLEAVQAAGLVHRDVRPANILITEREGEPRALVTDFGVARAAAATTSMTETGQFVGTLDYVAPEQLQGLPVDARTDVYALGCLLYETITGQVPFPGTEGPAKMFGHVHGEVKPIDPSLGAEAAALAPVVRRALEKRPDDRFPSAGDLGRAARAALTGRAPVAAERTVGIGDAAPAPSAGLAAATVADAPLPPPPSNAPPPPPPSTEPQPRRPSRRLSDGEDWEPPQRKRKGGRGKVLGGVLIALIAVGLAAAAVLLATSGKDDGGGEEQTTVAQQRDSRTTTVTETALDGSTITTTTVGRASPDPSADAAADAAAARVAKEGFTVEDTSAYDPNMTLNALVGSGSGGQMVFFFVDGDYIGTDTADPSGDIDIVSTSDTVTEVSYGIYVPEDPDCCPSGGRQTVRYSWSGSELQPLDPIPPTDPGATGSRR